MLLQRQVIPPAEADITLSVFTIKYDKATFKAAEDKLEKREVELRLALVLGPAGWGKRNDRDQRPAHR